MTQLKKVVDPFGEVNVRPGPQGKISVWASILMEPNREGAQTGIALDGSGSMRKIYGLQTTGGVVSSLLAKPTRPTNQISPIAQKLCAYLARRIDADQGTTCIYWATGSDGRHVEVIGDLTAEQAESHFFRGPDDFGTGTQLLPAVHYFVNRFKDAPWGFYVFVTDGEIYDLDAVKNYTINLARDIAAGRRRPVKFVLIGLGPDINERQMEDLDDLDTGTEVDLWDHKLASELTQLEMIFAEVVDRNARVADHGRILDARGNVIRDYAESGLPAVLRFEMPAGSLYFTLEVNSRQILQPLSDQVAMPPPLPKQATVLQDEDIVEVVPLAEPAEVVPPVPKVQVPVAAPVRPIPPVPASAPPTPASPPTPAPTTSTMDAEPKEFDLSDELAKSLDLEFINPGQTQSMPLDLENLPEDEQK